MAATVAAALGMTVVQSVPAFAADTSTYLVGLRANATRVDFPVGDRIDATVDVGTGNLSVLTSDLKLPGIAHDLQLGLAFNSLLVGASGSPAGVAGEWTDRVGYSTFINANADGSVAYYGPDGFQGTFTPKAGGGYTAPVGLKATLLGTASTGFSVRDHASNETLAFASSGRLLTITDRNSQATTFTWTAGQLATITSTRSGQATGASSRKAKFTYDANGRLKTITQDNNTSGSRAVTYSYTSGNLTGITDAGGRSTTFGYTTATGGDDLTSITNPGGQSTTLTYDGSHRVMSVLRTNTGGANAKTRFTYPSATQTLVADPTTNGAGAVSAVPHTTYTLDATERVSSVTDALGRSRSATYTSFGDVATSSSSAVTGTQNTTTFGHTSSVNSGESLTSVGSATGGSSSLSYGGAGASQYLPSGGTDGQSNASTLTYDGAGNSLSGGNTALAATASVTYNGDGTLKSSTSPAGKVTTYTEDAPSHQVTGITPPSGSGLGATGLTYDGYGRLGTVTDGRGALTTYSYDDLDRVTSVGYSGGGSGLAGVTTVAYTYDPAGNLSKRVDGTGTTTTGYDGLNRLTSRTDGAGVVVGYGYDANGNLTSATNGFGTTTYTYDDANQLTSYTGPSSLPSYYFYDGAGKRTDTYWRAGPPATSAPYRPTAFTAHAHTDYDRTGRVAKTWTSKNSSDATTARVFDTGYCYSKYVPGVGCPNQATSAPSSTDTGLVQYTFDNRTLERTVYTYDAGNRLIDAAPDMGGHHYQYGYDINGNRTSVKVDGTTTQTLTVNTASNQLTTTGYGYDAAGNLTSDPAAGSLTYNKAGQLDTRGSGTTYAYAGTGQSELTHEVSPPMGTTWDYSYGLTSPQGVPVLSSVTKNGATAYLTNDPTTGTAQEMHLATGQDDFYATNGHGSVVALLSQDSGGTLLATYTYDPYGVTTAITNIAGTTATTAINTNPYGYTFGTVDPSTGWVHHGARYHDTTTGRWTSVDPITRLSDPANANPYAYAGSDPINFVDPTGKFEVGITVFSIYIAFDIILISGAALGAVLPEAIAGVLATAIGSCVGGAFYEAVSGGNAAEGCVLAAGTVLGGVGAIALLAATSQQT